METDTGTGPQHVRKRLVICCDGTWNRPDKDVITNVEKIARTIETRTTETGGVPQLVLYLSGVGTNGYQADRLLGGAFGFGLFDNVLAAYRFLALNYEVGDEVFVFGFSRGAYTARSIGGMIGRVGLLTRDSLIAGHLPSAVQRYRRKEPDSSRLHRDWHGMSDAQFRTAYSHAGVQVTFLGVFDTVGALGVPGAFRRGHQFHDVQLSQVVQRARQALAVDEHRIKFEPSLWETADDAPSPGTPAAIELDADGSGEPRVKQVWFEGAHSDVGGGYPEDGLSDTTLQWMVQEAESKGLVFDPRMRSAYLGRSSQTVAHNSLTPFYRLANGLSRLRMLVRPPRPGKRHYDGHDRILRYPAGMDERIASTTADHFVHDQGEHDAWAAVPEPQRPSPRPWYVPRNLSTYHAETDGFDGVVEPVDLPGTPSPSGPTPGPTT